MRNTLIALVVTAVAVSAAAGCATKKYVNTQVAGVNQKVDGLGKSVEATQDRLGKDEGRLDGVDKKADAAGSRADAAGRSATDARSAADAANARAGAADAKATAADSATKKLIFEVALTDDKAKFPVGGATLSKEAMAELDALVAQLSGDPKAIYLEIEGHTDATGDAEYNKQLGLKRAEAVKLYLYEKHNIPLHKMSVISWGGEKPIAPNTTRDGRAKNRRVVIKVRG